MLFGPKELIVTPIPGEPFRFRVSSSRKGEPDYIVDVEARWPMARCTCRNYECVRWPEFKRTLYTITCKHCEAALLFYARQHIRANSKQLNSDGE